MVLVVYALVPLDTSLVGHLCGLGVGYLSKLWQEFLTVLSVQALC